MHLQWLNMKNTVGLIDVNPVGGSYQVLAQASTQEQMIENAAVLVRVLRRAHASRFKKYQEKLEQEKAEIREKNKEKRKKRDFILNSYCS